MKKWWILLLLAPSAVGQPLLDTEASTHDAESTSDAQASADAEADTPTPPEGSVIAVDLEAPDLAGIDDVVSVDGGTVVSIGPDGSTPAHAPETSPEQKQAENGPSATNAPTGPWVTVMERAAWVVLITTVLGTPAWLVFRRVAGALPFVFAFSRLDNHELLEQQTRRDIMEYIRAHPAASVTEVVESQDIAWGTAVYHLRRLELAGFILSEREGMSRRYWDAVSPEARERRTTRVLRRQTSQRIADLLCQEPGLSQADIRGRLRISAGAASQHLRRLQAAGFVTCQRDNCIRYQPTDRLISAPLAC